MTWVEVWLQIMGREVQHLSVFGQRSNRQSWTSGNHRAVSSADLMELRRDRHGKLLVTLWCALGSCANLVTFVAIGLIH